MTTLLKIELPTNLTDTPSYYGSRANRLLFPDRLFAIKPIYTSPIYSSEIKIVGIELLNNYTIKNLSDTFRLDEFRFLYRQIWIDIYLSGRTYRNDFNLIYDRETGILSGSKRSFFKIAQIVCDHGLQFKGRI
jgi:hypothetical protein